MKVLIVWTPSSTRLAKRVIWTLGTLSSILTLLVVALTGLSTPLCYLLAIPSFALLAAYAWFEHKLPIIERQYARTMITTSSEDEDANALE